MGFKLSISNIAWTAENDESVYALMQKYHYSGLEIAPTRILGDKPYTKTANAQAWIQRLANKYRFCVPSMQSILFGQKENIFGSAKERFILMDYMRKAIDFASECHIPNLVFGCPRNRNMPEKADPSIGLSFLHEASQYAFERGCTIGLEANPPIYHTNFINTTAEAFDIIHQLSTPGLRLNLDIGAMTANEESLEILVNRVHLISHVHISEPELKLIKKRPIHKELARLLKAESYQGYISIETGCMSNLNELEETLMYIAEVFGA